MYQFGVLPSNKIAYEKLDDDGLPPVGGLIEEGDPLYRLETSLYDKQLYTYTVTLMLGLTVSMLSGISQENQLTSMR